MQHRVLVVHPWIPARFNGAPLGLLYVAATARAAGHEVQVLDLQADPGDERFERAVAQWRPTVVALSSTSPSLRAAVELARRAKALDPEVVVVKGGVHETYCSEHTLAHVPDIDLCLRGEADETFPALLAALPDSPALADVPGLTWRRDGEVVTNAARAGAVDLDALPHPARDLLATSDYYDFSVFDGRRTTQVQTMRGCPFGCVFCNQRRRNPSVRSTASVVAELGELHDLGYRAVFFDDPTFTVNPGRTRDLLAAIRAEGLGMALGCQTRSELVTPELLEDMAAAGFAYISFGLETTDEQSLAAFGKTRSQTRFLAGARHATHWCRAAGIRSCLTLIVGFPGETDGSVDHTLSTAASLESDYVSVSALALYPHEDATTAPQYLAGVSQEPVWRHYDEGWGAIHPYLAPGRAAELLDRAVAVLGPRLDVVGSGLGG